MQERSLLHSNLIENKKGKILLPHSERGKEKVSSFGREGYCYFKGSPFESKQNTVNMIANPATKRQGKKN